MSENAMEYDIVLHSRDLAEKKESQDMKNFWSLTAQAISSVFVHLGSVPGPDFSQNSILEA